MAYTDSELINQVNKVAYNPNERGSWARNAMKKVDEHLNSLSPSQLLERYQQIDAANPGDIQDYLNKKQGVYTNQDLANYAAYKNAKEFLGRDVNANEFQVISGQFYNPADPTSGISNGKQYLATLAEQEKATKPAGSDQTAKYSGDINGIFSELVKRGATQDEINHFGNLMSKGQLDPYELKQFLMATPEYTTQQAEAQSALQSQRDNAALSELDTSLKQSDLDFFSKAKEDIISKFARSGTMGSTALDYALTDLMGKINKERQTYLGNLKYQNYQGNKNIGLQAYTQNMGNTRQDYLNSLGNMWNQNQYGQQQRDSMLNALTQRTWQGQDYNTQRNDYMNYLQQNKPRQMNPWTQAGLALIPAAGQAAGSYFGSR